MSDPGPMETVTLDASTTFAPSVADGIVVVAVTCVTGVVVGGTVCEYALSMEPIDALATDAITPTTRQMCRENIETPLIWIRNLKGWSPLYKGNSKDRQISLSYLVGKSTKVELF